MTGNQQRVITRFFSHLIPVVKRYPYAARAIRFIQDNPLYRGVLILGSGTAVAQLIGIISMPIITRLYTPSDLGILATYSSILIIVGIGATLGYEFAFALPKEDEDAVNLFGLCLILLFITTTALAFILFFGRELLIKTFDLGYTGQYAWLLLIGFFGMGLYAVLNYWAIRRREYKRITYTKINQGVGGSLCKILFGVLSFGPAGLMLGYIVSQIAGITTLARTTLRTERGNFKAISLSRMKSVAKTYRSFPVFYLPSSIVEAVALQFPPIALLALYDSQVVGLYALAQMLVVLPGHLISNSMGQSYQGEAAKMVREGSRELRSLYVRTLKHLSVIAIPLIGVPALCAPFVVPFIFGEAWVEVGVYCWPLAVMVIANFVASPTGHLQLYGYNHWMLMWNVTRVISVLIAFYLSHLLKLSVVLTITAYVLVMFGMYIVSVILNLEAIKRFTSKVA